MDLDAKFDAEPVQNPKKLNFVEEIVSNINVTNKKKKTIFFRINKIPTARTPIIFFHLFYFAVYF